MYQDFKDLLSLFNALGVKYLIVADTPFRFIRNPASQKTWICSFRPIPRTQE